MAAREGRQTGRVPTFAHQKAMNLLPSIIVSIVIMSYMKKTLPGMSRTNGAEPGAYLKSHFRLNMQLK